MSAETLERAIAELAEAWREAADIGEDDILSETFVRTDVMRVTLRVRKKVNGAPILN